MATSINLGYPLWNDGETFNALLGRTFDIAPSVYASGTSTAISARSGVLPAGAAQGLQIAASSGMNITINPGYAVIQSSTSSAQGAYRVAMMTQATLTVATADPTNPRIDLVVAHVQDNGDNTSYCEVALVTGTAAPIPSAPAVPANGMALAQISVAAGATSIVAGNITDKRVYTVPPGAILPVTNAAAAPAAQNGAYMHDLAVGRLIAGGAAGAPTQVHLLPFSPTQTSITVGVASTGTEQTVMSLTVTTDGSTDLRIAATWPGVGMISPVSGTILRQRLYIDSTKVMEWQHVQVITGGTYYFDPGTLEIVTGHGGPTATPSNGSHTISWKIISSGSGNQFFVTASTGGPAILRVEPLSL